MNSDKKLYLILSAGFVCFLVIAALIIPFLLVRIKQTGVNLSEERKNLGILENKQDNFAGWEKEYREIKEETDKINKGFLDPNQLLGCIVELEEIAKKTGNKYDLKVVEQQQAKKKKGEEKKEAAPDGVFFQISWWGDFQGLVRFLAHLENLSYFNEVLTMQIQRLEQGEGAPSVSLAAVLNIKIFTK